ncbi:hypothetical protein [Mucilaginibacter sp. KACC 22063]|uniref:hypothetical protein n=1 Tax=Mucilaginibacter sp. KACC 22063 TaxID=3025666 RepID=UPI0023673557|nr:hypothetical protein [Mucilaginibacter sp. KACC 22063]WDF55260.1 hypothetical protein PQ461_20210 [Mucilaginibacter sp. KACC 22063]
MRHIEVIIQKNIGILKSKPNLAHISKPLIDREACIYEGGNLIAIYKKAEFDLTEVRSACLNLKFGKVQRQSGILTKTLTINASARNASRSDYCRHTKFRQNHPELHDVFLKYGRLMSKPYKKYFKPQYAKQVVANFSKGGVNASYRISGTPFTSGVINKNTSLGYHKDRLNTKDGLSCMLILKSAVSGGELILPELNIAFACQDGYILLFDGQRFYHGVTPIITPQNGLAYRYTIVYYNNNGMRLCLPPQQELERYALQLDLQLERKLYLNEK